MVATVDGRVTLGSSASGLGSATDGRLMRLLRAEADLLLFGGGTLRAERFAPRVPEDLAEYRTQQGLPPQPAAAVVTASGKIPHSHPFFATTASDAPRFIFCSDFPLRQSIPADVEVLQLPRAGPRLAWALDLLNERGFRRVLCEGGPLLNGLLLAEDLVDELFLTRAARVQGKAGALGIFEGEEVVPHLLSLRSLYERDGELFLRYALSRT